MKRTLRLCWTSNVIRTADDRGHILHAGDKNYTLCGCHVQKCSVRELGDTDQPDCLKCRKILAALREQWAGELPLKHV